MHLTPTRLLAASFCQTLSCLMMRTFYARGLRARICPSDCQVQNLRGARHPAYPAHAECAGAISACDSRTGRAKACAGQVPKRATSVQAKGSCGLWQSVCRHGNADTEVLQAAHIQPYVNEDSNHVQNGLCLRADVHALFDEGLLALNPDYSIIVSERVAAASKRYRQLNDRSLRLPSDPNSYPSKAAIDYHRADIFVD